MMRTSRPTLALLTRFGRCGGSGLRGLLLLAALGLAACVEQSVPLGGFPDPNEGQGEADPPPAGQIGFAGYGVNRLGMIWAKVAGTAFYRLLKKPAAGTGFSQVGEDIPGAGNGPFSYTDVLQLHLTDWTNTSYMFEACNNRGCTTSTNDLDLSPQDSVHMIGYMKPLDPVAQTQFGYALAYSADGGTLAVGTCTLGAPEASPDTGSAYIFFYDGSRWIQQAKLKGSHEAAGVPYGFGCAVALSGDGNTVAAAAVLDDSLATGIYPAGTRPDPGAGTAPQAGAVYVFRRTGNAWAEEAFIKASNTGANDSFGRSLVLSRDGRTLAAGAIGEDSNAAGPFQALPHGAEDNELAPDSGAVYVFARDGNDAWSQQAYLKAADVKGSDWFGAELAIADDGDTLAVAAPNEDSAGIGAGDSGALDDCGAGQGPVNCLPDSGAVYVFVRDGSDVWSQQVYLKASNPGQSDALGSALALSGDGNVLVAGAPFEDSAATLVGGNQDDESAANSGAVYQFRRAGTAWSQERYFKASNTEAGTAPASADRFGAAVALSGDGSILAVGAPYEDSYVSGINVPVTGAARNSAGDSGAAYVYRDGGFLSFIKSSHGVRFNPGDLFGSAVALSADGNSLAVGAIGNDCPFTGQAGLPVYSGLTDDMQPSISVCGTPDSSGAVYLY